MNTIYFENLDIYRHRAPREAILLSLADDSLCHIETKGGQVSLVNGQGQIIDSEVNAIFIENTFSEAVSGEKTHLFIYGIGLGFFWDRARRWLEESKERRLVVFEPSLEIARHFFHTERAKEFLQHPQVSLHFLLEEEEKEIRKNYWAWLDKPYEIMALPYYAAGDTFKNFASTLRLELYNLSGTVSEYLGLGAAFFRNFYFNLPQEIASYYGNALYGRFKGVPAIVTGAGPSLEKAFSYLEKWKDRALIVSGGSSMKALGSHQIFPHLGMGVDPNHPQAERFAPSFLREIPFLYTCRFFHPALTKLQAPLIYLSSENGYLIDQYYEKNLKLTRKNPVEGGYNVINSVAEYLARLGCSPIIFVGLDLAFTNNQTYSKGIIEDTAIVESSLGEPLVIKKDIFGKPVKTIWKWVNEAKWFGKLSQQFPKITFLNATGGGLALPGIKNVDFEQVDRDILTRSFLIEENLHAEIQSTPIGATMQKLKKLNRKLEKSLIKTISLLEILIEEVENRQSAKAALAELEIGNELACTYLLESFSQVANFMVGKLADEKHAYHLSKEEKDKLLIEANRNKFLYLRDVAQINLDILKYSYEEAPVPSSPLNWDRFKIEGSLFKEMSEGLHQIRSKEGTLLAEVEVKNGKRTCSTLYYPSGQVYVTRHFIDGKRDGEEKYYRHDGTLRTTILMKKGRFISSQ